jgi:lipopolysaccharide assembly outer membrane protein LptD (OstA)
MTRLRAILTLAVFFIISPAVLQAQQETVDIQSGDAVHDFKSHFTTYTNGVIIKYKGAVLTAESGSFNHDTEEAIADGNVRIFDGDMTWTGDHIRYNFKTHQMVAEQFRTGKVPTFAAGKGLHGDITNRFSTNQVYNATNALITADNVSRPAIKIRAKHIRIIPQQRIEAWNATLYFGEVPVFYLPYYERNLGEHANNFNFTPGYRSSFGPFLLTDYTWYLNEQLDGGMHLDYLEKRGVGAGPDFNYHLGRWGDGTLRYYYLDDHDAGTNAYGMKLPENRQRVYFTYQANPYTNLNVKSVVRDQSDSDVTKDFFEGEYRQDPQLSSFLEVNKFWQNFSLDTYAQPRINDFYQTVERLPDVRFTGFIQQLGDSPLYYESESSVGYYRQLFGETNGPTPPDYSAARADTYHQLTLPQTFFGWLNFTPRAGGRFTYYSKTTGPGATNDEAFRGVFNTGAEVSFKASQVWPGVQDKLLDLDGLRHIVEPSVNYVFVPTPNYQPNQLPQFDSELPSLRMLPLDFPEYNSIDSIDSENVVRFGLQNKLQTKRDGQVEDLLNWEVDTDWRLRPGADQTTFSDVYSDLTFKPRSWIVFQSQTRYDIDGGEWRMALHSLTLQPNNVWSWTIGHFYLRTDNSISPTAWGPGDNAISSSFFFRLNENWGIRSMQHFDAGSGRMQEQYYTIYRDLRSWTAAVTVGLIDNGNGPKDFTAAFTFSLKAKPRFKQGTDTVQPYSLLGN